MKKTFMKIATLAIMAIGLTGCGAKMAQDGLYVNTSSVSKENSKTKVYYKDLNKEIIADANKKFVEDISNMDIIPENWFTVTSSNEITTLEQAKYSYVKNDSRKKVEGIKLSLSEDEMSINFSSNAESISKFIEDYLNFYSFVSRVLKESSSRDKYLAAKYFYGNVKLSDKLIEIRSKQSFIYKDAKNDIKKQVELGGWQMVDSPEKADKEIYFELSRDYFPSELKELKKQNKGIRFLSWESGNKFSVGTTNYNNGSHIVAGQSAMSAASSSNSDLTSAVIGLGVSAIFSTFGNSPKQEISGSFASLRVIDKVNKKEHIKLYSPFIDNYNDLMKNEILPRINNSINRFPNDGMFDINK